MRPLLSPRLARLNADVFLEANVADTTVNRAAHRSGSTLDDLALGDDEALAVGA